MVKFGVLYKDNWNVGNGDKIGFAEDGMKNQTDVLISLIPNYKPHPANHKGTVEHLYNLQPRVYLDSLDALHQGFIDLRPVAIVKPQSQNPERENNPVYYLTTRGPPISTLLQPS